MYGNNSKVLAHIARLFQTEDIFCEVNVRMQTSNKILTADEAN